MKLALKLITVPACTGSAGPEIASTVGATLATEILNVVEPKSPSLSVTLTVTVYGLLPLSAYLWLRVQGCPGCWCSTCWCSHRPNRPQPPRDCRSRRVTEAAEIEGRRASLVSRLVGRGRDRRRYVVDSDSNLFTIGKSTVVDTYIEGVSSGRIWSVAGTPAEVPGAGTDRGTRGGTHQAKCQGLASIGIGSHGREGEFRPLVTLLSPITPSIGDSLMSSTVMMNCFSNERLPSSVARTLML